MQRLPNGNVKSPLSPSSVSPTPQQVSQQYGWMDGWMDGWVILVPGRGLVD